MLNINTSVFFRTIIYYFNSKMINNSKWKYIIATVLTVLTIVYIYFSYYTNEQSNYVNLSFEKVGKYKIDKDGLKNITVPENMIVYYFPEECPDYMSDILIEYELEEGFKKYFLPEKDHIIVVIDGKHKWTKSDHSIPYIKLDK